MNHARAVAYVEGLEVFGMRFGLQRMQRLLDALGDPQRRHPCVHVVGTNGKTSTTRMTAAILSAHGLRTGAYTSPHIEDWSERIRVDGEPVSREEFAAAVGEVRAAVLGLDLAPDDAVTQFEVLTAAAFVAHARAGVGAAVIEAGLGGRWDATNVLDGGRVTAFTGVALEHTALLGDTLEAIAEEKLAVMPDGASSLVVGALDASARLAVAAVLRRRCLSAWWLGEQVTARTAGDGTLTVDCPGGRYEGLRPAAEGAFQRANATLAVAVAHRFTGGLRPGAARDGLRVRVPGRMETVPGTPPILLDGAHNPEGMRALVDALPPHADPVAVVAVLDDKDASAMLRTLAGRVSRVVVTRSGNARAMDPHHLAALATGAGMRAWVEQRPEAALQRAIAAAGPRGSVLVCGSLSLLADLRPGLVSGG